MLIWPTYTNIGIDDRNQYDMIRSMPGGIAGIKKLVDEFHTHGVKVRAVNFSCMHYVVQTHLILRSSV